jgi:hypothetical protein
MNWTSLRSSNHLIDQSVALMNRLLERCDIAVLCSVMNVTQGQRLIILLF